MKRILVWVGLVAVGFSGGAACSSGDGENDAPVSIPDSGDTTDPLDGRTGDTSGEVSGTMDAESFDAPPDGTGETGLDSGTSDGSDAPDSGRPAPNRDWTELIGTSGTEGVTALATTASGGLYAVGWTSSGLGDASYRGGARDAFVAKYTSDGSRAWVRLLGSGDRDQAHAVAVDDSGRVYVAGVVAGRISGHDFQGPGRDGFLAKYGPDGTRSWVRVVGESGEDVVRALSTASTGEVHIAGSTENALGDGTTNEGGLDGFIATYDALGTRKRLELFGGLGDERTRGLGVDGAGNLYATGWTSGVFGGESPRGANDLFVASFDPSGAQRWTDLAGSSGNDRGFDVAVGPGDALYVCGSALGDIGNATHRGNGDALVAKYDTDGARQWLRLAGGSEEDFAARIEVDTAGARIVGFAGSAWDGTPYGGGARDLLVASLRPDGTRRWLGFYGGPGDDAGYALAGGPNDTLFVGGSTTADFGGETFRGGSSDGFLLELK